MATKGPIIFIDDDPDDHLFYEPIFREVAPDHPLLLFTNGQQAIDYLRQTADRPFLIIAEVSLEQVNIGGIELRRQIEADNELRKRAIPFIFLTHPVYRRLVEDVYQLTIQGLFEKKGDIDATQRQLTSIISYWEECVHPNRLDDTVY